jgi:dihydroorotate dehydrogenase electron transfer subunit
MVSQVDAIVLAHEEASADYRVLTLRAPELAAGVRPGQFVHVRVPNLDGAVLRRPFSVFTAEGDGFSILYKRVGRGTNAMQGLKPGDPIDVLGPLGNGFPLNRHGTFPLLVAGGYGVAPLFFLAQRLTSPGLLLVGGATGDHVLLVDRFQAIGWSVEVATEDGSLGEKGRVTVLLDRWLAQHQANDAPPEAYACGPDGMLRAVGSRAQSGGWNAWLSLDQHMGCGVGACLACVHRLRRKGTTAWGRVCKDGPVFESREIVWSPT